MLDWLRNLLESRELTSVRGELAEATAQQARLTANVARLSRINRMLLEPATMPGCRKIRLRDAEEATVMARKVEQETRDPVGSLEPYQCRMCPRHPLTLERFWHVTHTNKSERGQRHPRSGKQSGLLSHVSPEKVRELRERTRPSTT